MPTHHPNVYISQKLPNGFAVFLHKMLIDLRAEMNRISRAFYQYKVQGQEYYGVDNLFSIIERTWLGVFNNALVRNADITVLQEFNVWNSERNIGRCDLLFRFEDENEEVDIFVEAKFEEFIYSNNFNRAGFYKKILDQAYKYYKAERKYYEKEVRLMAIVFELISNADRLEAAKTIMNDWKEGKDPETDFLSLYYGDKRGVFVYGKIVTVQEYERQSTC